MTRCDLVLALVVPVSFLALALLLLLPPTSISQFSLSCVSGTSLLLISVWALVSDVAWFLMKTWACVLPPLLCRRGWEIFLASETRPCVSRFVPSDPALVDH